MFQIKNRFTNIKYFMPFQHFKKQISALNHIFLKYLQRKVKHATNHFMIKTRTTEAQLSKIT